MGEAGSCWIAHPTHSPSLATWPQPGATCCLYRSPPPTGGRRTLDLIGSVSTFTNNFPRRDIRDKVGLYESDSDVTQSCQTLSDPMDCSVPRSSIHAIFQARVLKWGAIAFSKESMRTRQTSLSLSFSAVLSLISSPENPRCEGAEIPLSVDRGRQAAKAAAGSAVGGPCLKKAAGAQAGRQPVERIMVSLCVCV